MKHRKNVNKANHLSFGGNSKLPEKETHQVETQNSAVKTNLRDDPTPNASKEPGLMYDTPLTKEGKEQAKIPTHLRKRMVNPSNIYETNPTQMSHRTSHLHSSQF